MKKRCDIAKILNHCGGGIKLYDVQRGMPVIFNGIINDDEILLHEEGSCEEIIYNKYATLLNVSVYPNAATMLIPSPNNPDWEHFFTPGDVVIQEDDNMMFLVDKVSSDYRHFSALYAINLLNDEISKDFNSECNMDASMFNIVSDESANDFINKLEEHFGGKFNEETWRIDENNEKYHEGDYLTIYFSGGRSVFILKSIDYKTGLVKRHASISCDKKLYLDSVGYVYISDLNYATEDEISELTDILRANNKRWNPETLKVENAVDIKEYVFKPKDWCLMRDIDQGYRQWILCQFSHLTYEDITYYVAVGGKEYTECIPYEGNEELLGTDKPTK